MNHLSECPAGRTKCIWNGENNDEDYCFSPRMRFDPHAKCVDDSKMKDAKNSKMKDAKNFKVKDANSKVKDDAPSIQKKLQTKGVWNDHIREVRDSYIPAFTLTQTELYMSLHEPSSYICCPGCTTPEDCLYDDRCDCCLDHCRCCAGVCFH